MLAYHGLGWMMPALRRVTMGWPTGGATDADVVGAGGATEDGTTEDGEGDCCSTKASAVGSVGEAHGGADGPVPGDVVSTFRGGEAPGDEEVRVDEEDGVAAGGTGPAGVVEGPERHLVNVNSRRRREDGD